MQVICRQRKDLLLDCDGVLADMVGGFLYWLLNVYGVHKTPHDIRGWGLAKQVGIAQEDEEEFFCGAGAYGRCVSLSPYAGAKEFLIKLQERHNVIACTASKYVDWTAARAAWLAEFGIPVADQIICGKLHKQRMVADHLIDDSKTNCFQWGNYMRNLGVQGFPILVNQPWNQVDDNDGHELYWSSTVRANSYEQILEIVG